MQLSTSVNVFDPRRTTALDAIKRLAAAGFRHLDFNFVDWCYPGSPFVGDDWQAWVQGIRARADALGLRLTQAHGPIFDKWTGDERCVWLTDLCHRSIRGAAMLDVPWIVFEPETRPGPFDAAHLTHLCQRNLDWFAPLLRTAEPLGVGLALENTNDPGATSRGARRWYSAIPAELIDLVDGFSSDRVGICWDVGHAHIQRLDQPSALAAVGDRLKAIHVQDNDGQADQHLIPYTVAPGHGVDWPALVQALRHIDYGGDFTYEVGGAVRRVPDPMRDALLRYMVELGAWLLG